ncbi:beta-ketoacyl synthase N-terminal-like domain-containing protein [uncultured Psychroserpens sp.]|uniref:beta-ketoacyl synthase N-terminal-like domain-containing protein n=1 Tax=uncultured Psychroserpens sp. TaxID=255436 RepID=UPI0026125739|nr:beta-ketoacyl synthase N-terminal-like domain-containing protein [uncultured Psychroserpens sp.]
MLKPISITAISSISPLGYTTEDIWGNYKSDQHFFTKKDDHLIAELPSELKLEVESLRQSNSKYKTLDDTVLYAILTSRQAIKNANWTSSDNFGINIGSSRGATALFENFHKQFLEQHNAATLSSPTTTLGNISSWVAHDLKTKGPEISHSITCSTALHALLNGIAWINSGMSDKFLVGGSEAPLTPFTIAQMKALKIYAKTHRIQDTFPCQALNLNKRENSMILAEGAAMACLEKDTSENTLAQIIGFGYATEILEHNASLSKNAICFQRSMEMAISNLNPNDIDVIVTHTPGTIKGDQAEINAINAIFCNKIPTLTTNKWKAGHSLGASGLLSIEMAIMMLKNQEFISIPYLNNEIPKHLKNILVNAVGFGGNAVSVLLSK